MPHIVETTPQDISKTPAYGVAKCNNPTNNAGREHQQTVGNSKKQGTLGSRGTWSMSKKTSSGVVRYLLRSTNSQQPYDCVFHDVNHFGAE